MNFEATHKEESNNIIFTDELIKDALTYYYEQFNPEIKIDIILESYEFVARRKKKSQVLNNTVQENLASKLLLDEKILLEGGKKSSIYLKDTITKKRYNKQANTTVAKLNKNGLVFWANPPIEYLSCEWIFILNDVSKRKLIVFDIPALSIDKKNIYTRVKDGKVLMDIEIKALDCEYTCKVSHIKFFKWFKEEINY